MLGRHWHLCRDREGLDVAGYPLGVLINKEQDRRAGCAGASSLGKWGEVGAGLGWAWCACGGLPNKGREKTVSSGTQAGQGVGRQGWAPPHMEPRCVLLVQLAQAPHSHSEASGSSVPTGCLSLGLSSVSLSGKWAEAFGWDHSTQLLPFSGWVWGP